MLLGPAFPDSGAGPVAGRCEKSLRDDDGMIPIEILRATKLPAAQTERSLCVLLNYEFLT